MTKALRLDRLIANLGYGSRKEAQWLVAHGRVALDGAALRDADQKIALSPDLARRMRVNGEPLDPPPGMMAMLHKPVGVTCSHKEAGPLVYSLLPERWRRRDPPLSTVGRLDKETSGLLLITDDGQWLHRLTSPRRETPKTYLATLARPLRGDAAALFASGAIMLEGEEKPLLPAILEPLGETSARVTVTEGRYHQVRRMFAALGNHVEALHRERFGAMALPTDLPPGAFRLLTDDERAALGAAD